MKKLINSIVFLSAIGLFSSISVFTSCSKASASSVVLPSSYQNKMLLERTNSIGYIELYTMSNDGSGLTQIILSMPNNVHILSGSASTDGMNVYFIGREDNSAQLKRIYKSSINGGSVTMIKEFDNKDMKLSGLY